MAAGGKRPVVMGAEKAAPNGVATLGADGKLAEAQRPVYTGEDIPVSGEDDTILSAALSNKATNLGYVSSTYETVLDVALSCSIDSSFFVDNASSLFNAADAPWGQREAQYLVSMDAPKTRRTVVAVLYDPTRQPQIAIRPIYNGAWLLDWTFIPIITPPQQFDLPLAAGLIQSSASWYSMDQFNQVHVHGAVSAGSGSFGWDTLVATLPEGYRTGAKVEVAATFSSGGTSGSCAVAVSADGTIRAFPDISAGQKVVYFDLLFLAESGLG